MKRKVYEDHCPRCGKAPVFVEPEGGRAGRLECPNRCLSVPVMHYGVKASERWNEEVAKWQSKK